MKAFEEWFLPDKDVYVNEYKMQKRAWKAALELALDVCQNSPYPEADDVSDRIKEELKE